MISENSLFGFATLFFVVENENCIGKKKASPLAEYIILFRSKKKGEATTKSIYTSKEEKEHKLKQKAAATTTYNNKVYDSFRIVSFFHFEWSECLRGE